MEVWSRGESMASSRPMVTRRLDSGFELAFSLKQLYPDIAAGDLYSLQLRAYMPVAYKHIRVRHARGQAAVHVAHTLLLTSSTDSSDGRNGTSALARGSTAVPLGLNEGELYHLHVAITCDFTASCAQYRPVRLCQSALRSLATPHVNSGHACFEGDKQL